MEKNKRISKDYYLNSSKFVRDVVLGYVYLTEFDIEIIDTLFFQRLKDIRQLTCQQVFPSARHTRFEHSLGVMELTRQAIKNLNKNGFVSDPSPNHGILIDEQLQFNAALAALLHDVGHCPFSHLGEEKFDIIDVWSRLYEEVKNFAELENSELLTKLTEIDNKVQQKKEIEKNIKKAGAKHEQLSCIIILKEFGDKLLNIKNMKIKLESKKYLYVDFELILRSILGIKYDVSTKDKFLKYKEKNVIVSLISSSLFDMDKLDYIMRDSWHTAVGTPQIDTQRLFRNMYLNNTNEYKLIFTNRAVPALQNIIESRDELYMYVYNHHTAVFSDFMNSYIFRRLEHNERDLLNIVRKIALNAPKAKIKNDCKPDKDRVNEWFSSISEAVTQLGAVSRSYLFSPDSVLTQRRTDSDLISLLAIIHYSLSLRANDEQIIDELKYEIEQQLMAAGVHINKKRLEGLFRKYNDEIGKLCANIKRAYRLIDCYQKRIYLKPWWKTNSEFSNFINANFRDDRIREDLCHWVCYSEDQKIDNNEFCSQLAKNVTYITKQLYKEKLDLLRPFENEEFLVIQRSAKFFVPQTIKEIDIALKNNEIIGSPGDVKYCVGDFYIKSLTNVIPQRDYYSMYAEKSFYIFSRPIENEDLGREITSEERSKYYRFIEQIFVFVATTLVSDGERAFQEKYGSNKQKDLEEKAHEEMYKSFKKKYLNLHV